MQTHLCPICHKPIYTKHEMSFDPNRVAISERLYNPPPGYCTCPLTDQYVAKRVVENKEARS